MDPDERDFKERDLKMREEELFRARRSARINAWIALAAVVFSATAVLYGIKSTSDQARSNDKQFRKNVRDTTYNNIITGLGSSSGAVQVNSMRLLSQYIREPSNYDNRTRQNEGVVNAIQTLVAFIEDKSSDTSKGLTNYESPQPIVLSRAMNQLKLLVSDSSLGSHETDISRANLHGISLATLAPQGPFTAIATDFRRANLKSLDLTKGPANLNSAFFTCANLAGTQFGEANVEATDFSGADLSDADLRRVKNLRSEQLHGVKVSNGTRFPKGISVQGDHPWLTEHKCSDIVDQMTGMISAQGYVDRVPCPLDEQAWTTGVVRERFTGDMKDLVAVCTARISG